MTPETAVGLLAEPDRLRVLSAVCLGAATPSAVARASGVPAPDTARALGKLLDGGLVERTTDGELSIREETFREMARASRRISAPTADPSHSSPVGAVGESGTVPDDGDTPPTSLARFVHDGRIRALPARQGRRRELLLYLAQRRFLAGTRYAEREVDAELRAWCVDSTTDHVTVRRSLIELGVLRRENGGAYWLPE